MRKYFSSLFIMVLLIVKAATIVVPIYSVPLMLTAVVPLITLGTILFVNREKPFSSQFHWIAVISAFVCFVLPLGPIAPTSLHNIFYEIWEIAKGAYSNQWFIMVSVALFALQLFFRTSTNVFLIVIRYSLMLFLMVTLRNIIFPETDVYKDLIILSVILCMVGELNAGIIGNSMSFIHRCAIVMLSFLLMGNYGERCVVIDQITELFQLNGENWTKTVMGVFVIGILILQNDYYRCEKDTHMIIKRHNVGWVILIWCLMVIVMNIWTPLYHSKILLIGIPLISVVVNSILRDTEEEKSSENVFIIAWFFLSVALLMLAKSLNMGLLLRYTLIALLILFWVSYKKIAMKIEYSRIAFITGISSILIMATMRFTHIQQIQANPTYLLGTILMCLMWSLICNHGIQMGKKVSEVHPKEFLTMGKFQMFTAVGLLLITAVRVLIVF